MLTEKKEGIEVAKKATKNEAERADKPDFEKALKIIRGDINRHDQEMSTIRGEMSGAWKAVEKDCHVNKKGARIFRALFNMEEELRDDCLRTLYGLMAAAGIGVSQNLVDAANGVDVPSMPVKPLPTGDVTDALH